MAITETILQHDVLTKFAYPFLLIFFIVFAILEKTKILGDEKKQLNALVAFIIGLIFVSVTSPKMVVENLILFLTVAIIVVFVGLLLWGFVSGSSLKEGIFGSNKAVKWVVGVVIVVAVLIALFWASGIDNKVFNLLFGQSWSKDFWTNAIFIAVVGVALAVIMKSGGN